MRLTTFCVGPIALATIALAHGGEHQKPIQAAPDANWATKHMAEEHHITEFSPESFFALHDFNTDGHMDSKEFFATYGLNDDSNKHIQANRRSDIYHELMRLMDKDGNGEVSRDEFVEFHEKGGELPDFGTGPGHHGDDEYEYEIHHWELYHDENTREEDLIHPEDIEHFRKHDEMEDEAYRIEQLDKMSIVEQNIPLKFRKQ